MTNETYVQQLILLYAETTPLDTGRKLNIHKLSTASSERLMYV